MFVSKTRILAVLVAAGSGLLAGCAQRAQVAPPLASKPTVGQEIGAVAENKIVITFPVGGFRLNPDANQKLDLAARLYRDVNPSVMFTMGYTDRRGSEMSNIMLSARRAEAVKAGLVARGIPADRLMIQAFGESELANSSDPLAVENRRVAIMWRII